MKRILLFTILFISAVFTASGDADISEIIGSWQGDRTLGDVYIYEDGTGELTFLHNSEITMAVDVTVRGNVFVIEQTSENRFEYYTSVFPQPIAEQLVSEVRPFKWIFTLSDDGQELAGRKYTTWVEADPEEMEVLVVNNSYVRDASWARLSGRVEQVEYSPESGEYDNMVSVELTCPTPGSRIFFTVNGDAPTVDEGQEYTGSPIEVQRSMVLKAIAVRDGWQPSEAVSREYIINNSPYDDFFIEYNNFIINLTDAEYLENGIQFSFLITNQVPQDRSFTFNRHVIRLITPEGQVFDESYVEFGTSSSAYMSAFVGQDLVQGVPIVASVVMTVPERTEPDVALLELGVNDGSVRFTDIPIRLVQ
ncbi:MAG: chitobiase/beta-hexosaminidase C-terminal domain-containing protein [Spirochaetia bacterium]